MSIHPEDTARHAQISVRVLVLSDPPARYGSKVPQACGEFVSDSLRLLCPPDLADRLVGHGTGGTGTGQRYRRVVKEIEL